MGDNKLRTTTYWIWVGVIVGIILLGGITSIIYGSIYPDFDQLETLERGWRHSPMGIWIASSLIWTGAIVFLGGLVIAYIGRRK